MTDHFGAHADRRVVDLTRPHVDAALLRELDEATEQVHAAREQMLAAGLRRQAAARALHAAGWSYQAIADHLGVSRGSAQQLVNPGLRRRSSGAGAPAQGADGSTS